MHQALMWCKTCISTSSMIIAAIAVLASRVSPAIVHATTLAPVATPKAADVVPALGVNPAMVQASAGTGLAEPSPCSAASGPIAALVTSTAAASAAPACAMDVVAVPLIAVKKGLGKVVARLAKRGMAQKQNEEKPQRRQGCRPAGTRRARCAWCPTARERGGPSVGPEASHVHRMLCDMELQTDPHRFTDGRSGCLSAQGAPGAPAGSSKAPSTTAHLLVVMTQKRESKRLGSVEGANSAWYQSWQRWWSSARTATNTQGTCDCAWIAVPELMGRRCPARRRREPRGWYTEGPSSGGEGSSGNLGEPMQKQKPQQKFQDLP